MISFVVFIACGLLVILVSTLIDKSHNLSRAEEDTAKVILFVLVMGMLIAFMHGVLTTLEKYTQ